ncbi:MAG: hypothetical protein SF339_21725 [Blastocatellia bacterium]|nr:hypothetical protein [Blastocatellia bacterium]
MLLMTIFALFFGWMGEDGAVAKAAATAADQIEYRLLATNKTSTMEKEMNQAAAQGFRFEGTMGGETAAGGNEIVVIMSRRAGGGNNGRYDYRLLATRKTSTMTKELNQAGAEGFLYTGQSIYDTAFGGREVVVILERTDSRKVAYEYQLLATNRTSTQEKELNGAGRDGFLFCGITVANTSFGGREVVSILRREIVK